MNGGINQFSLVSLQLTEKNIKPCVAPFKMNLWFTHAKQSNRLTLMGASPKALDLHSPALRLAMGCKENYPSLPAVAIRQANQAIALGPEL